MATIKKWKTESKNVAKLINNPYLQYVWDKYEFPLIRDENNNSIPLDSNINVYEACFISQLIEIYIKTNISKQEINVLEIGLARGTSTITIMNKLLQLFNNKINYDSVDLSQTDYWKNVGMKNIEIFLTTIKKLNVINHTLTQESSVTALPRLRRLYDIIFIDGSHTTEIVIQDLNNSHRMLIPGGLIIIDDVLHKGVQVAINIFKPIIQKYYSIVYIKKGVMVKSKHLYDFKLPVSARRKKRDVNNPNSMFCIYKNIINISKLVIKKSR